jgi:hypothetical protein
MGRKLLLTSRQSPGCTRRRFWGRSLAGSACYGSAAWESSCKISVGLNRSIVAQINCSAGRPSAEPRDAAISRKTRKSEPRSWSWPLHPHLHPKSLAERKNIFTNQSPVSDLRRPAIFRRGRRSSRRHGRPQSALEPRSCTTWTRCSAPPASWHTSTR